MKVMKNLTLAALCAVAMLQVSPLRAQQATEIALTYSKGQFQPSQVSAPADKPITYRVKNLDAKAMEFESKSLRVEKVVAANSDLVPSTTSWPTARISPAISRP